MRRRAKFLTWSGGVLGSAIVLVVIVLLAVQPYVNSRAVRRNIENDLSRRLGGTVTFERIDVSLFPLPGLTFKSVNTAIPKTMKATFASVSVYPQLIPLLHGKLLVSRLRVRGADVVVKLPQTLAGTSPDKLSLGEVKAATEQVLAAMASVGPGLVFELEGGTMTIVSAGRRVLTVRKAGAEIVLPPGPLFVDLHGSADPWGGFLLKGSFLVDEEAVKGEGVDVRLGHSELSGLSVRLDWGARQGFEVREGKASLALGELFSWTSSSQLLLPFLKDVTSLRGEADLGSLRVRGLLTSLRSWTWNVRGRMKGVVLESDRLPAPLSVTADISCDEHALSMEGLSASLGRSSLSGAAFRLDWKKALRLQVLSARAEVSLDDLFLWRSRFGLPVPEGLRSLGGTVRVASLRVSGPVFRPRDWRIAARGSVEKVLLEAVRLPGRVTIPRGEFTGTSPFWSFSRVHAAMQDSSLTLSGTLRGLPAGVDIASVVMNGSVGRETLQWLFAEGALPSDLLVRAPVVLSGLRLAWRQPSTISVAGNALIGSGTSAAIDLLRTAGSLAINQLAISDADSSAKLAASFSTEGADLSFSGHLAQSTLHRIFESQPSGPGTVQGDLQVKVPADPQQEMEARGTLEGRAIAVPGERKPALRIEELSLHADGPYATVQKAALTLGGSHYDLSGTVTASGRRITIDGDATVDRISVVDLAGALFGPPGEVAGGKEEQKKGPSFTVDGLVRVKAGEFDYAAYRFSNLRAQAAFGPGHLSMTFTRADTCGLSVPGTIVFDGGRWQLDITASAAHGSVERMLSCLTGQKVAMSGTFDLAVTLRSKDEGAGLIPGMEGRVDYSARDGKIYRYPLLAKILSVLSVTDVLRGKVPELGGSGFSYYTLTIKASIERGRLKLEQAMIDGTSLTIIAQGEVDLATRKADLVVLVAPFSTVNWIIRHIPIVGSILGGTLISVPVKVSGDIADPKVVFLAPSAVDSRIVTLLENIVELPVELISPLLPEKEKAGK